jgi:uncharacterized membrane protein (UPF0127 family)
MAGTYALINARTRCAVADDVAVAVTRSTRRQGLLGRDGMEPFTALVLAPCAAVHTMFMRFSIDVIFLDADGRAIKIVPDLAPWRAAATLFARAVIELPAGTLASREVSLGDTLYLSAVGGGRLPLLAADLREAAA